MKISLFYKALYVKACFLLVLFLSSFNPQIASAGLISNLIDKVFGAEVPQNEVLSDSNVTTHNSQTIPLPEASVNPDIKNVKEEKQVVIVSNEALLPNIGSLGVDTELEKYASSEKIDVYIVKKGDTIEGIAKKLKVSKASILASNADLKKSDLLKIGQTLVISTLKSAPALAKEEQSNKKKEQEKELKKKQDIAKEEVKDEKTEEKQNTPVQVTTQAQPAEIEQAPISVSETTSNTLPTKEEVKEEPAGQNGTIGNGYIWLFPKGVGRVSQGLHADQAYDFAAPLGTPVYAPYSGTILIARDSGYNGGYGKYVVINFTDGRQAILGHMQSVVAVAGQEVKQGDIIAYVGSTGKSTGPHVHIGFRGTLSNPYKGLKVNDKESDYAHD